MPLSSIANGVTGPAALVQPLVATLGDPAGIGPEIVGKAWDARHVARLSPFCAIGDAARLAMVWQGPVQQVKTLADAATRFDYALPVIETGQGAAGALAALEMATRLTLAGEAGALITGPVHKHSLYEIGFPYPGQTEFVAARCGVAAQDAVMMLAGPGLKVVPITTHIALADVPLVLTIDLILRKARITARAMRESFGIATPRLAIAGLNPHCGENGTMGHEEQTILRPAIEHLRNEGIMITDPLAADTLFHPRARETYDVVLCMYHDQALIPLKTLYFDEGVNITLGLPIVRTSPDHGTAFDIAGKNIANPGAMIAALQLAAEVADRRAQKR